MRPWAKSSRPGVGVLPVVPGDLVVLAVGVVVAVLGAADLVAAEEHGHALRQEQRGQEVALLAAAQRDDVARRRSGPRRRSSTSGCRRCRRGCPRRWPRCACRCTSTRSASVKPSWAVMKLMLAYGRRAAVLVEVGAAGEAVAELGQLVWSRRARSRAPRRGTCRSTPTTAAGSCRPGSRPRRRPTARR